MILIIIPTVIWDITLMNGLLKNVNHYVLVIGLMTKKLIHAIVSILVLNMSIMILLLKLVFLGTLLLNAQDQDSLMVLIVNVKFQVLFG
jgi:hypothetical protein